MAPNFKFIPGNDGEAAAAGWSAGNNVPINVCDAVVGRCDVTLYTRWGVGVHPCLLKGKNVKLMVINNGMNGGRFVDGGPAVQ